MNPVDLTGREKILPISGRIFLSVVLNGDGWMNRKISPSAALIRLADKICLAFEKYIVAFDIVFSVVPFGRLEARREIIF